MQKRSAGILLFRRKPELEFLLVHPGGPLWARKDVGAWTIPKGELDGQDPLQAAIREFAEETGDEVSGDFIPLTTIKQASGKEVLAWAVEGDLEAASIKSNTFEMEWPPKSGRKKSFPEIDRAEWFTFETADAKINPAQTALLRELKDLLRKNRESRG